jgi:rhamnosyltransferase
LLLFALLRRGDVNMAKPVSQSSVCAIIVSYEPDAEVLLSLLEQINEQADFLLLDNGSANAKHFLPKVATLPRCVGVQALDSNIGLASALNLGLQQVEKAGYGFAVMFDQDSQIPATFFVDLMSAYLEAKRLCSREVAAIGPRIRNPLSGRLMPFTLFSRLCKRRDINLPGSKRLYQAEFLISSGCMIAVQHLAVTGNMKDSYFIDNVDLEWCFRARSKGFALVGTDHAVLHHSIGLPSEHVLVRKGWVTQHSPLRSYYSTRNRFALYRQPYAPWGWKLRDFPRFILKTLWLLASSPQRAEYWQSICRGLRDSRRLE